MECGDYQGTIGFLDNFKKNNKSAKKISKIISNLSRNEIKKYIRSESVEFEDGFIYIKTEMTAEDVAAQLKRLIGPKLSHTKESEVSIILANMVLKTNDGVTIKLI